MGSDLGGWIVILCTILKQNVSGHNRLANNILRLIVPPVYALGMALCWYLFSCHGWYNTPAQCNIELNIAAVYMQLLTSPFDQATPIELHF